MAITKQISRLDVVSPFARRIKLWAGTCADYNAAATLYGQLSRLSDAELRKRGLARDRLARHVCETFDKPRG